MCALRTHIKLSIFRNIFSKIEKVVITFSIIEKIFPNIENLMCVLRTHINQTHIINAKLMRSTTSHGFFFFLFYCAGSISI